MAANNNIVTVQPGQTSADLTIQKLGSMEAWFTLAQLNGLSITDDLVAGTQLAAGATPVDSGVVNAYAGAGVMPASATTINGQQQPDEDGGLGYMALGNNFIIS